MLDVIDNTKRKQPHLLINVTSASRDPLQFSLFAGMRWKTKDIRLFAIRVYANDGNVIYSVISFWSKYKVLDVIPPA